ncbi:MAG: hypothetical protein WBV18_14290, partial [Methyloceanibacter sp.]
ATQAASQAATQAATLAAKEAALQAATEAASLAASEAANQAATQAATQVAKEAARQAATDAASRAASEAATQAAAQAATLAAKEAALQAATDATSLAASEAASQAATQAATQTVSQAASLAAAPLNPAPGPAPVVASAAPAADPLGAPPLALSPEMYQQPAPAPYTPSAEEQRPAEEYSLPPMPRFDAHGRQVAGGQEATDLDQAAGGLPPQFSGSQGQQQSWAPAEAEPRGGYASTGAGQLRIDELARSIDIRTATEVWYRMRAGERGVLGRHIYTYEGQATFDEISGRYDRDPEFRNTVDRYVADFERLLAEAEQSDPAGNMLQNYLTSETGRVYLLLAHASGRLR